MALGAVAIAQPLLGGITFAKSPRYGGGNGPLYSTVNGFSDRVATGDLGVIKQLDQLRKTDADKEQWQLYWDEMLPIQPLTQAQVDLIKQLDPTKSGLVAHRGSVIYAAPGVSPPDLQTVLSGIAKAVQGSTVTGQPQQGGTDDVALSNAFASLRPSTGGLPLWALTLLAVGVGFVVYKASKGR